MMLKIAHMRENRKNNKGFSLVELIIVMAIMVALVAVLAPQYIRYLQRSRDAVVVNAAEDVLTAIKTDLIDPEGELKMSGSSATVVVKASAAGATLTATPTGLEQKTGSDDAQTIIQRLAGISTTKEVKSNKQVTITITYDGAVYNFSSSEGVIA